jgi:protein-L-isoaspartate(D-aspartate) O-methyltransferase
LSRSGFDSAWEPTRSLAYGGPTRVAVARHGGQVAVLVVVGDGWPEPRHCDPPVRPAGFGSRVLAMDGGMPVGWELPPPSSVKSDADLGREREAKVAELARSGLLRSGRLREAMRAVGREEFVPPAWRDYAYAEVPLPLPGRLASISCPHSYPLFYEALGLNEGHRFLEIGLGSGYGAALAREVVGPAGLVVSVEIDPVTLAFAAANLDRAGYTDVVRVLGDGALGHPALAPYDRICVTAACPEPPAPLLEQLRTGGRLIAPIQQPARQVLTAIEKQPDGLHWTSLCDVLYVSLQGPFGTGRLQSRPPALIVTARSLSGARRARRALHRALPGARVKGTGFTAVLAVDAEGDPAALAAQATGSRIRSYGRVVTVLAQVPSARAQMVDAVARAAAGQVRPGESFCVRLHKRGAHGYLEPTPALERAAGTAAWEALHRRDGTQPRVDLVHPDVTIHVEVLGPRTLIGVARTPGSNPEPAAAGKN